MTEPEPIHVSFRYIDLPERRLGAPFSPRLGLWAKFAGMAYWIMVMFPLATILSFITSAPPSPWQQPALFGPGVAVGMAFGLGTILLLHRQTRASEGLARKAFALAPSRRDGTDVVLDASGILAVGAGSRWHLTWAAILSVEELDDFTLIRPSEVEYLPIPHANLPPGITPEDLRRAIAHWRGA